MCGNEKGREVRGKISGIASLSGAENGNVYFAGYGLGNETKECFGSHKLSTLRQIQFFPTASPHQAGILKAGLHFLTLQTSRRGIHTHIPVVTLLLCMQGC